MGNIKLTDYIDVDMLWNIQNILAEATHMNVCVLSSDGEKITDNSKESVIYNRYIIHNKIGMERFHNSERHGAMKAFIDETAYVYECFTGMLKISIPIFLKGQYAGSISAGEVVSEAVDKELCYKVAEELDIDKEKYYKDMCSLPLFSEEDIKNAVKLAEMAAELIVGIAKNNLLYKHQIDEVQMVADSQMNYVSEISIMMENAVEDIVKEANAAVGGDVRIDAVFDRIIGAANGLAESVEDTIEYAKYSEWQLNNNDYNFNVEQMIDIVCGTVLRRLTDKEWKLSYDIKCDEETELMGDAGCVSQVLNKLIGYCVNTLESKDICVEVDCKKTGYATYLEVHIKARIVAGNDGILYKINESTDYKALSALSVADKDNTQISVVGNLIRHMNGSVEFSYNEDVTDFFLSVPMLMLDKE